MYLCLLRDQYSQEGLVDVRTRDRRFHKRSSNRIFQVLSVPKLPKFHWKNVHNSWVNWYPETKLCILNLTFLVLVSVFLSSVPSEMTTVTFLFFDVDTSSTVFLHRLTLVLLGSVFELFLGDMTSSFWFTLPLHPSLRLMCTISSLSGKRSETMCKRVFYRTTSTFSFTCRPTSKYVWVERSIKLLNYSWIYRSIFILNTLIT